jgi:methyl-accepting chemotaxis protein
VHSPVPHRLLSLPLRVKVLTAVALACLVALLVGVLGLVQLGALQQRSQEIKTQALVPSNQIAEVRRAFLQTRIDALADEMLPRPRPRTPRTRPTSPTSTRWTRRSRPTRPAA